GPHHAGACDQRHDLVAREHQRRKLKALAHEITHARLAIDRYPGRLQVGYVAVDGALGYFQALAQHAGRHEAPAAQLLHDLKKSVGSSHARSLRSDEGCAYGKVLLTA